MLTENLTNNNEVQLCGTVESELVFSHEVYGEGFYQFTLNVPRLSDISDKINITVSERGYHRSVPLIQQLYRQRQQTYTDSVCKRYSASAGYRRGQESQSYIPQRIFVQEACISYNTLRQRNNGYPYSGEPCLQQI